MRPVRKLLAWVLIALLTALPLSGCWDRRELEERTSVVALAIDRVKQPEGAQPLVRVSVQIPIPIKIAGAGGGGGGGGEGGKSAVKVMGSTGFSMADALKNLQQRLNQELFYGHTRVIAVSEDVAREDMTGLIDSLRRSPQMRRMLWLVIVPGEAIELLGSDPKLEQIPIVYVMDLIENGARIGRIPDITLGRWFIERSATGIQPTAVYIQPTAKEVKWNGLALFKNDQMIGSLDVKESWVLMQIKDKMIGGDVTVPCPGSAGQKGAGATKYVSAHPKKIHVKTDVTPYQGTYRMKVNIEVENDITESMCELDYKQRKTFEIIERELTEEMNARARKLIEDCQRTFKVDAFGMGNKVRARYMNQFEQLNWDEEFQKAKIEVHYSVKVRRAGMKMQ